MNKDRLLISICWLIILFGCIEATAQEKKLVIWSHWGQEPVKVKFMQAIAEGFQQDYGIPVEIVWMSKPELMEKLPFALDTPEPDITYIDHGFTHPRIWRSLLDLSDLQFTGQREPTWALASVGDASNNFLPIEGLSNAIYYNTQLFERAGIILPQDRAVTHGEFLDIVRKLREAGITPIGEGSSDRSGKIGIPIINSIFRFAGPEKTIQLLKGDINFSDPDVVQALTFWKQVVDVPGYDRQKALELTLLDGIFEVTDGNAAISFCGTYLYGKYGTTARDQGQIGVLDWFTVEHGKGNTFYEIFWAAGYGINHNSHQLEDAKKFLEYLMRPAAGSLWVKYVQSPYPVMPEEILPDSLYGQLMLQRKGQKPAPQPFTYTPLPSQAAQQMWEDAVRRFITGEHTVELFVERMNSRLQ